MRRFLVIVIFFLCTTDFLTGQKFSVAANIGWHNSMLSKFKGFADTAHQNVQNTYTQELSLGYLGKRGFTCAVSLGTQKEIHFFQEIIRHDELPGLSFYKRYGSFPLTFTAGYLHQLSDLPKYYLFANAALGAAKVKSIDVDKNMDGSGTYYVLAAGTYDTIHYTQSVVDNSRDQVQLQARLSVGAEFRVDHFFVRASAEYRTWGDYFGEITYHSEYSSTLHDVKRNRSGSYSLRTAYTGFVFSAGFYFPKKEKSS